MKRQLVIFCALILLGGIQAHASITPTDMKLQKQGNSNVVSYVQSIDSSNHTVTMDQVQYLIRPSAIVHDGDKIASVANIHKGSRIKVELEKKIGQLSSIKEIWIFQSPSGK